MIANLLALTKNKPTPVWVAVGAALGLSATQLEGYAQPVIDALLKPTVQVHQLDPTTKCVVASNYGNLAIACSFTSPASSPTTQPKAVLL